MDMASLLSHIGIQYQTEGQKHCRPGWINMACCWCTGNPGLHLGWNVEKEYFYCWRCGYHPTIKTLTELSGLGHHQVMGLVREYGGRPRHQSYKLKRPPRAKAFRFPSGLHSLQKQHLQYLERRRFDPEKITEEWHLLGAGPVALLDGIDYKWRIIIPIYWGGNEVSFQGRDITGKTDVKYRACPKDRELVHHKDILYGKPEKWGAVGICVEGVTDVWRLGDQAFATFGINYKISQLSVIAKRFKQVAVVFDDDPQAIVQAKKLVAELRLAGVQAWREEVSGDPGGMSQDDANYLVREIMSFAGQKIGGRPENSTATKPRKSDGLDRKND